MHTVTFTPPLDSVPTSCFAVPPPRVGHTMIRPRMKEMATQTEMASNDPRHGLDTATRWADKAGYDLEPAQTVQAEISAQLLHHIRLNPDSAQEPLIILNGISQAGVYRFFDGHGWRARMEDGARVWECKSPSQLHKLLRLDNMSKLALGPCRLHVRGSEAHGHRLLMACPPFTAWFMRKQSGRTELRLSFKICVFQDTTDLTPPPGCSYSNEALRTTEQYALSVLLEMSERQLPLSPSFFRMLGQPARALQAETRAADRIARLQARRARAVAAAEESEESGDLAG